MTAEEIKSQYSMRDILYMYGMRESRSGFISCPFHGKDSHPSMKIYRKDYHCFTCGANGDIFTFVQGMENCSFKEAFLKLGGTYEEKTSFQQKKFRYELEMRRKKEQKEAEQRRADYKALLEDIKYQKLFIRLSPVFSDLWCDATNRINKDFLLLDEMIEKGGAGLD